MYPDAQMLLLVLPSRACLLGLSFHIYTNSEIGLGRVNKIKLDDEQIRCNWTYKSIGIFAFIQSVHVLKKNKNGKYVL